MARSVAKPSLADVLVSQGVLPKATIEDVLRRLKGVVAPLGHTLVSEGFLSEDLDRQTAGPSDQLEERDFGSLGA